jgi:hypothetical protein
MSDEKKQIRNSTAEFLIFTAQAGEGSLEVRYEDETIWLTQKLIAQLFDVTVPTINEHLKNILASNELQEDSVIRKFRITAADGKSYDTQHYNLDAIISVGYRVNSVRATQFRQWATGILRDFAIRGYVLDRKRMENGTFLNEEYFDRLLEEIREIRLSERLFHQKVTDIYATAIDYNAHPIPFCDALRSNFKKPVFNNPVVFRPFNLFSPNGASFDSPGQRPGNRPQTRFQALKGRHQQRAQRIHGISPSITKGGDA